MTEFVRRRKLPIIFVILMAIVLTLGPGLKQVLRAEYHTQEERDQFEMELRGDPLTQEANALFMGSGECATCHGYDWGAQSNVTETGIDINPADQWRSTMMANSARDPLWRAKVSHEILVNPGIQTEIENTCTRCHAPAGNHFDQISGNDPFTISEMEASDLALDGVTCTVCHLQTDSILGQNFTGTMFFDLDKVIYGQYPNPFSGPMFSFVGYDVQEGPWVSEGEFCGSCHTLITATHDLAGSPTGNTFVEQATYHEWANSDYKNLGLGTCQDCHMPSIPDSVYLANGYTTLEKRSPWSNHYFVGGNVFMLNILKSHIPELGLTADSVHFDSTIARTLDLLQTQTLDLTVNEVSRTPDTVFYDVQLTNNAGHKFPSGYPARIAYIEFIVLDDVMDTIFKSGVLDGNYNIVGRDPTYEPHHQLINEEDEVQIYEMVMGDVIGNPTTVLERADAPLKDNRLVPLGFNNTHFNYADTTFLAGNVLTDADFNDQFGAQGTGTDNLNYHIPLGGYTGQLNVRATVYYMSVPRRWLDEMFSYNSAEIDTFRNYFNEADHTPIVIDQVVLGTWTGVDDHVLPQLLIYPNPSRDGVVFINNPNRMAIQEIQVFDLTGKLVHSEAKNNDELIQVQLPDQKGLYLVVIRTKDQELVEKVTRY